jgi:hypothetical protein
MRESAWLSFTEPGEINKKSRAKRELLKYYWEEIIPTRRLNDRRI